MGGGHANFTGNVKLAYNAVCVGVSVARNLMPRTKHFCKLLSLRRIVLLLVELPLEPAKDEGAGHITSFAGTLVAVSIFACMPVHHNTDCPL